MRDEALLQEINEEMISNNGKQRRGQTLMSVVI